jgi:hypothetical protein
MILLAAGFGGHFVTDAQIGNEAGAGGGVAEVEMIDIGRAKVALLFAGRSVAHTSLATAGAAETALRLRIAGGLRSAFGDGAGAAADQSLHVPSALGTDFDGFFRHFLARLEPDVTGTALILVRWHELILRGFCVSSIRIQCPA